MEYCAEYAPLISAAVDGEVSPEERRELMEHLAQCPACREAYEQMLAMQMAFEELDAELPGDLAGDVMAKIRSQQKKPRRRYWMQLSVAAACCALVFLGYRSLGLGTADHSNTVTTADSTLADSADMAMNAAADDAAQVQDDSLPEGTNRIQDEEVVSSDEQIMESVLTYFHTAPKVSMYTADSVTPGAAETAPVQNEDTVGQDATGEVQDETESAVEVATISSSDPALVEWMEGNTSSQEYTRDGATAWLVSIEEGKTLEAFLVQESIPYSTDSVQLLEQTDGSEMVCVVYLGSLQ